MGVDTKGVILTSKKDFWEVRQTIGHALYRAIRPHIEMPEWRAKREGVDVDWKLPEMLAPLQSYSDPEYISRSFQFIFKWNGEERILWVHTDCDCDLQASFGEDSEGIILSLGMWGSSEEIMKMVLEDMKGFGECYFLLSDVNDDWEKIGDDV